VPAVVAAGASPADNQEQEANMSSKPIRVVVWDENPPHVPKAVYPKGIRGAVADGLRELGSAQLQVSEAHLDEPGQGVPAEKLAQTDVLLWWGHVRHGQVSEETVARVVERVHKHGLGFIALHSAHHSRTFKGILNCTGHLKGGWREDDQPEEIRVAAPRHPIAAGIQDFTLPKEEMYGSPFETPPPQVVVLQSYFPAGGEYFPSGAVWTVGEGIDPKFECGPGKGIGQGEGTGRVFYFRPGHESAPTYFDANVRKVLLNAVRWAGKQT
jgi:trehalose utilization protein